MGTDIHSYIEVRANRDAPWELLHTPVLDEDGRLDVPYEEQPFGFARSSTFVVALTGIISARVEADYSRLQPLVPEDRPLAEVSAALAPVLAGWDGGDAGPYWLALADLEQVNWDALVPIFTSDGNEMTWADAAPYACAALRGLREVAGGRDPHDVRIVFWLDW